MTRSKKLGVLTFHRCINYGSYWQARVLVEGLRARGYDAELLDHDSARVNRREWRCAFRPTLPTAVPATDFPLYREKIDKFQQAFAKLPLSPRFDLDHPERMECYDTVVVGSDEVWNLSHPWFGGSTLFYGEGANTNRLVSYAASFGNYDAWAGLDPYWANFLKKFDSISIRDYNSQAIIRNALGCEPEMVLDPCLQFPITPDKTAVTPEAPYVVIYGHNFSYEFQKRIQQWAGEIGVRTLSLGYRNDWADEQWLEAGPHDFAATMANATAVATNFFHGCVFSVINHRPFVCESSQYRNHKVQGLMTTLGAEKHLVTGETSPDIYRQLLTAPPSNAIDTRIQELRRVSDAFLDRALLYS